MGDLVAPSLPEPTELAGCPLPSLASIDFQTECSDPEPPSPVNPAATHPRPSNGACQH